MRRKAFTLLELIIVIIISSLKITGCEQEDLDIYTDCDNCLDQIPDSADLWIDLTINDENPLVPLEFYIGDYEDGEIYRVDTVDEEFIALPAEIGTYYSVKAKYQVDGKTLYAIDGDKLKVVNGDEECGPPCYYITAGTLDVRIKE